MRGRTALLLSVTMLLVGGVVVDARAGGPAAQGARSPALCAEADTPETGIQGDVPAADRESGRAREGYNCGLSLVGWYPGGTAVQAYDHCMYVRTGDGTPGNVTGIDVVDVADPARPVRLATLPTFAPAHGSSSETMRLVATGERAVLVTGSGVYDVSDCANPVVKGQIQWPGLLPWPAGLSHDIRISFDGTKVWAALGVTEADITDLDDPARWTVENHTCAVGAQYHPVHSLPAVLGLSLCDTVLQDAPPQIGHGPALNGDGTRLYVGNQLIASAMYPEDVSVRILDVSQPTPQLIATLPGPGHSVDWFRAPDGREFLLHANELVFAPLATCIPAPPRPASLGLAFGAFLTDITDETAPERASRIELAIDQPEHCADKLSSAQNTAVAYHAVDNPFDARFAMVSMGNAGLRLFDIRDPYSPSEVAYFNVGQLAHAGVSHYDADRGLLYVPGGLGVQVLELHPQVVEHLDLPRPTDPAYPRFPNGRGARPRVSEGSATIDFAPATFDPLQLPLTCRIPL